MLPIGFTGKDVELKHIKDTPQPITTTTLSPILSPPTSGPISSPLLSATSGPILVSLPVKKDTTTTLMPMTTSTPRIYNNIKATDIIIWILLIILLIALIVFVTYK